MKSCLLLLALLIPTYALADDGDSLPLVSTSGKAEVRVVPDLADLWFDVEVRHADLAQARKLQAQRAEKVVQALRAAGIAEADLQTSQVTISPSYIENRQETANIQFLQRLSNGDLHGPGPEEGPRHHGSGSRSGSHRFAARSAEEFRVPQAPR